MWLLKMFWSHLISQLSNCRGDIEGGEGTADNAEGAGKKADNSEGAGGEGGEGGQEGEGGAGEGGDAGEGGEGGEAGDDNIDEDTLKLFGGDEDLARQFKGDPTAVVNSYKELMKKNKPTEMENAAIKGFAKKVGLKMNYDAQGNFTGFSASESTTKTGREKKFTDEHRKTFSSFFKHQKDPEGSQGTGFLDLLSLHVNDLIGDAIAGREEVGKKAMAFRQKEVQAEKMVSDRYPDANPDSDGFPEGGTPLYNRSTEIYQANDERGENYRNHPWGQLYAVNDAALELGIQPQAISAAKKKGKEEALANKRILSRVGGGASGGAGKVGAKKGEVDMEAFMKMSPAERKAHQEKEFKKKQGG